jgi:hypothetical protein
VLLTGNVRGDLRKFGGLHGIARLGFLSKTVPWPFRRTEFSSVGGESR